MATLRIPTIAENRNYTIRVDNLDGTIFRMRFLYNTRSGFWHMDLLTDENEPLKMGVKVVLGSALLRLLSSEDSPQGELLLIDSTGTGTEATLESLGGDQRLVYEEISSLLEAAA